MKARDLNHAKEIAKFLNPLRWSYEMEKKVEPAPGRKATRQAPTVMNAKPKGIENGKGSKEFREGYESGYSGKPRSGNPYNMATNMKANPDQQNDWTTGHVYGSNAVAQNKPHMFKNEAFQNGANKALTEIQNKATEAGIKVENGRTFEIDDQVEVLLPLIGAGASHYYKGLVRAVSGGKVTVQVHSSGERHTVPSSQIK